MSDVVGCGLIVAFGFDVVGDVLQGNGWYVDALGATEYGWEYFCGGL